MAASSAIAGQRPVVRDNPPQVQGNSPWKEKGQQETQAPQDDGTLVILKPGNSHAPQTHGALRWVSIRSE